MNSSNNSTNATLDSTTAGTGNPGNNSITVEAPVPAGPPTPAPAVKKAKVSVTFINRSTDAILIVMLQRVLVAMTGNAAYTAAHPTLATVTAALNGFIAAVNAAHDSKIAKASRNQQRAALEALARQLAQYVQTASGGDLPTLLSSGFPAQRTQQPVGVLPVPQNLRLRRGKLAGTLDARCKRVPKAGAYQWRFMAAPGAWVYADPTLAASTTLTGLTPGLQYTVQVRAIGSSGAGEWSDVAGLMVV